MNSNVSSEKMILRFASSDDTKRRRVLDLTPNKNSARMEAPSENLTRYTAVFHEYALVARSILSRFSKLCRTHSNWMLSKTMEVPPFEHGRNECPTPCAPPLTRTCALVCVSACATD